MTLADPADLEPRDGGGIGKSTQSLIWNLSRTHLEDRLLRRARKTRRKARILDGLGTDGGPAPPYSDAIVTLSALAANTSKIKLGSAVVNFYTRNPAWIASSFSAISDLASRGRSNSRQRMIIGLGAGSPYNLAKFGIHKRSGIIVEMREAIESIRELLEGKEVTVKTEHFSIEAVSLSKVIKQIPIHIGAVGPKSLRLAGEIADGVILTDRIASDLKTSLEPIELGIGDASRTRRDLEITQLRGDLCG